MFLLCSLAAGLSHGSFQRSRKTPAGARPLLASLRRAGGRFQAPPRTGGARAAAVDLEAPIDADAAVEGARRRGRGAQSNASGRYEPIARIAFDDGWQSLEELPPFETTVTVDSTRKIITRNEFARHFVRPLDQSLSRLRARLHLLLRAADPRLSRAVARPRLRIQAVRQARRAGAARAGAVGAELRAAHHRDRHQHRSLSADRAQAPGHAPHPRGAGARRSSGRHRHQIGAGLARSRHPRAAWRERNLVKVALSVTTLDAKLARTWSRARRRRRGGSRRCGSCRRPAFRPR